ncbi:hypothetical protein VHEMI05163 [[Torrubiella] hemipterigena]|uniref:DRBM domain-containing protein n=1 Tax=[Torrubiella] hemipterigena TaxID=1531966 RepID=A0A0A1T3B2_9HYPO|nr:hypothetical protein VHEMI05163 [[Torrubiella] hemipterigena]
MDTNGTSIATGVPIPWCELRAWIDEHEQAPEKLSREQLMALSYLVPFTTEPDLVDGDYVSELMLLAQGQRRTLPTFQDSDSIDVPEKTSMMKKWRTTCTVPWLSCSFPVDGFSYAQGEQPPLFASKKKAKQYAAKEALRFIKSNQIKPPNTTPAAPAVVQTSPTPIASPVGLPPPPVSFLFPPPPLPPPPPPQFYHPVDSQPQDSQMLSPISPSPPSQVAPRTSHTNNDSELDDDADVMTRINKLCHRLGFSTPGYVIVERPDQFRFFDGYALFHSGDVVPRDLTTVNGIFGKKQTKLEIAYKLHHWLTEEDIRRQSQVDGLFEG